MKDALAERLLAQVMAWSAADVAAQRPVLQALALLKYDEYQQFSPGMRFVESLALWLEQFEEGERKIAYDFLLSRLIFFSEAEMAHFAGVMYPDFIRPLLLRRAADVLEVPEYDVGRIASSAEFQALQTSTLFFGLSDGARIDQFRRSNRELKHEQIFSTYELPPERIGKLAKWLNKQQGGEAGPAAAVVLLDDFAGSGTSYVRYEEGELDGKLLKFVERVATAEAWKGLVRFPDTTVIIALYIATAQALEYLHQNVAALTERFGAQFVIVPVQLLGNDLKLTASSPDPFVALVERYYDDSQETDHTRKGKTDVKYGFASCGLPLVLHHNTPNNSLFLLWVEDSPNIRPVFQRFSRFRRDS